MIVNANDPILGFIEEIVAPTVSHPSEIVHVARLIKQKSPDFDEEKFIQRTTKLFENQFADELAQQQADYQSMIESKDGTNV